MGDLQLSQMCENSAGRPRFAGERQASRLPDRGTPTASLSHWQNSSSAMRRTGSGNCEATSPVCHERRKPLASDSATLFIDAAEALAPQIRSSAEDGERERRLSLPVVEAMAR